MMVMPACSVFHFQAVGSKLTVPVCFMLLNHPAVHVHCAYALQVQVALAVGV
jgi:hypothetical protein